MCSRELPDSSASARTGQPKLVCACDACAILFSDQAQTKYQARAPARSIPAGFRMTDSQWDGLDDAHQHGILFQEHAAKPRGRAVSSPAGATESLLAFETWEKLNVENPVLLEMEADVEALLVNQNRTWPRLHRAGVLYGADRSSASSWWA